MPLLQASLSAYRQLLPPCLFAVGATIFINDHVVEQMSIKGSSMAPTLSPDFHTTGQKDRILFRKWMPSRDLRRGDVVAYQRCKSGEPRPTIVCKRIIGLPGDRVLLDPRRHRSPEPYARGEVDDREAAEVVGEGEEGSGRLSRLVVSEHGGMPVGIVGKARITVPQGYVWVEGDNWRGSKDSNVHGPISKSLIIGKAEVCVWPLSKFWTKPWEQWEGLAKLDRRIQAETGSASWG